MGVSVAKGCILADVTAAVRGQLVGHGYGVTPETTLLLVEVLGGRITDAFARSLPLDRMRSIENLCLIEVRGNDKLVDGQQTEAGGDRPTVVGIEPATVVEGDRPTVVGIEGATVVEGDRTTVVPPKQSRVVFVHRHPVFQANRADGSLDGFELETVGRPFIEVFPPSCSSAEVYSRVGRRVQPYLKPNIKVPDISLDLYWKCVYTIVTTFIS
jgi:RNase P/RNase MRP subunit p29